MKRVVSKKKFDFQKILKFWHIFRPSHNKFSSIFQNLGNTKHKFQNSIKISFLFLFDDQNCEVVFQGQERFFVRRASDHFKV